MERKRKLRAGGLDGPDYPLALELITACRLAVANRIEAAQPDPFGRGGFEKMDLKHRDNIDLLVNEIAFQASVAVMLADDSLDFDEV